MGFHYRFHRRFHPRVINRIMDGVEFTSIELVLLTVGIFEVVITDRQSLCKSVLTGTHLLIEIIDASWKANAHYNGICMRRGDCSVCVIHFL